MDKKCGYSNITWLKKIKEMYHIAVCTFETVKTACLAGHLHNYQLYI